MPYDLVFISTVVPALIMTAGGVGAVWIVAQTWLRGKKHVRPEELTKIAAALELLQQSVEDVRDDLRGQVNEIREISGRVEFAERLLTEKKED